MLGGSPPPDFIPCQSSPTPLICQEIDLSWSPIQIAEQPGPGCHLTAAVQPQQTNFGHFKPILICKSDTWKASSLYPHSMCSLARKGSAGVLLCHSLGVTLVSHLPLCNASCREIGRGGRKHSAGNQYHLLSAFQKLQTQSWWARLCS